MDLSKSNEIWGDIVKVKRQAIDRPELLVSLNYLPQAARLTVNVIRAKNLENEDLFVKVRRDKLFFMTPIKKTHDVHFFHPTFSLYRFI